MRGTLDWAPVGDQLDLVAGPVRAALTGPVPLTGVEVAAIDPALADTAAFCERYATPPESSANCVVVAGRRGERTTYAAVMVLATDRADVNGIIRKRLDARKCSFAPGDEAVRLTGMEFGGITPIGVPADWPILVDPHVLAARTVIVGSGVRASKLLLPAGQLLRLPNAEELALTLT